MLNFEDDREYLSFDDVALLPRFSPIESRSYVRLTGGKLDIEPFIPANMASVISPKMAHEIQCLGGLPILHRFYKYSTELEKSLENLTTRPVGISLGVDNRAKFVEDIKAALQLFVLKSNLILCIDIAHAHSKKGIEATKFFKDKYPELTLISGNVGTAEGALALFEAGADIVKVGISNGAVCTTRVATGHGVPQLTSVADCATVAESCNKEIIADGGIKSAGDAAKAMAAGANYVMIGRMFAQCKESGGRKIPAGLDVNKKEAQTGQILTEYYGSASQLNKSDGSNIEGEAVYLPVKYTTRELYNTLSNGLRSAFSYSGARNPEEFRKMARFIRVSTAGYLEGLPHAKSL